MPNPAEPVGSSPPRARLRAVPADGGRSPEERRLSRKADMRALRRLLEYALAESQALALAVPARLLGAAAMAVSDEISADTIARRRSEQERGKDRRAARLVLAHP